jgi:hypothetical protein
MSPRFVTKRIHSYLDYPVAVSLMAMPFLLSLGSSNPIAKWSSVGTGIAAFILTLLTDHQLSVVRMLPYSFHLAVDLAVGVVSLVAPIAFGFICLDAVFYWANGIAVMTVVGLHKPATEHQLELAAA